MFRYLALKFKENPYFYTVLLPVLMILGMILVQKIGGNEDINLLTYMLFYYTPIGFLVMLSSYFADEQTRPVIILFGCFISLIPFNLPLSLLLSGYDIIVVSGIISIAICASCHVAWFMSELLIERISLLRRFMAESSNIPLIVFAVFLIQNSPLSPIMIFDKWHPSHYSVFLIGVCNAHYDVMRFFLEVYATLVLIPTAMSFYKSRYVMTSMEIMLGLVFLIICAIMAEDSTGIEKIMSYFDVIVVLVMTAKLTKARYALSRTTVS